jgi:hypothetical protein
LTRWLRLPLFWLGVVLLVAVVSAIAFAVSMRAPGTGELERFLTNRGDVALVGDTDLAGSAGPGSRVRVFESFPETARALGGEDGLAVSRAMVSEQVGAILVDTRIPPPGDASSVRDRLQRYEHVNGLRAVYLVPSAAVYVRDELAELEPPLDEVLAYTARKLLEGAPPPRVSSFPEPLRAVRNVEVMVMLERNSSPRLWRSARGSSVGRALITAAVVARQRWEERAQAMGGPIDDVLPELDVSVVLLGEDGTLGDRTPAFIDRVFTPDHGVAFERKGNWRYSLPDATARAGEGSASRAYAALFDEYGLEATAYNRTDLRLYRLVATRVALSPAAVTSSPSELDLELDIDGEGAGEPDGAGAD